MKKLLAFVIGAFFILGGAYATAAFAIKYKTDKLMIIPVEEVSSTDYPEDPADHSAVYSQYGKRSLRLEQKSPTIFNFIFESDDPNVATVTFERIDVSLFVPTIPDWTRNNSNLETIALTDIEWNRQEVNFDKSSPHLKISGGDGFEQRHLYKADLARNCLNAGLWEVLLFTYEDGKKTLYYQGWFTFPLGHYKKVFEKKNKLSYWKYWYRLEHWIDPAGTPINLQALRAVVTQKEVQASFDKAEKIIVAGEQLRKSRTFNGSNIRCWGDFCREDEKVQYLSFIPPGRYSAKHPWNYEYEHIAQLDKVILRKVRSPATHELLDEIELVFRSSLNDKVQRFIVSGIRLDSLPQLSKNQYPKGLYMPMGIGVPPFYQSYDQLEKEPPEQTPYFSLLLDEKGRWINHHEVAIDGPVIHKDPFNPNLLHLYLLSYERHSLVGHIEILMAN